jgi:Flp pilus assembly protein TadG
MSGRTLGERGASVVETALVLPIFLAVAGLLLFAGWLGTVQSIVAHGAREGARYSSIPSSTDLRSYPSDGAVAAAVEEATPLLSPTRVTVTSGTGGASRFAPVTVRVEYSTPNPFRFLLAPLRAFGWGDVSETLTISSQAKERRE